MREIIEIIARAIVDESDSVRDALTTSIKGAKDVINLPPKCLNN